MTLLKYLSNELFTCIKLFNLNKWSLFTLAFSKYGDISLGFGICIFASGTLLLVNFDIFKYSIWFSFLEKEVELKHGESV